MPDDANVTVLKRTIEGLKGLAGSTESALRAIRESDRLPEEAQRDRRRALRDSEGRLAPLIEQGHAALNAARASVATARRVSASQASSDARERVRALLTDGADIGPVAERAAEVGDTDTLRALYGAIDYVRPGGKFPAEADIEGLRRVVDRGLAAHGDRTADERARAVEALGQSFESHARLASAATTGEPRAITRARLAAGYAESAAQGA